MKAMSSLFLPARMAVIILSKEQRITGVGQAVEMLEPALLVGV